MSLSSKQQPKELIGDPSDPERSTVAAATVVLLRDREGACQVLMLRKSQKINFGGMWVFPGGHLEAEDFDDSGELEVAARRAAVREAREETGLFIDPASLFWFAQWTAPLHAPRRYCTWFFVADAHGIGNVQVDGGEIEDHVWISPESALALHAEGKLDVAPPTWVTLFTLSCHQSTETAMAALREATPRKYQTRIARGVNGARVALWAGDAGFETGDAEAEGPRHRLVMDSSGFRFEHPKGEYNCKREDSSKLNILG